LETRGGRSVAVHRELARGATVKLAMGADVLIGPCDAHDVAKAFFLAAMEPEAAAGLIFNVGSAYALTASEFVATYAEIYGVKIPIERVPWSEFCDSVVPEPMARHHFEAHMCPDISSIRAKLGFEPRFTPPQTMSRAVEWMRTQRLL
jgi:nucleoside-diphosphate-sugar epimerase